MIFYPFQKKIIILRISLLFLSFGLCLSGESQEVFKTISFTTRDEAVIYANLYLQGNEAVILAHGAVFNKESWDPLAKKLAAKSYTVLAIDFRGYGSSTSGSGNSYRYLDILGAIDYFKEHQYGKINLIGGSMGASASIEASIHSNPGDINSLILLAPGNVNAPQRIKAKKVLYVVSKGEYLVNTVKELYRKTPGEKSLEIINGNAHAQHIFKTPQANKLTKIIFDFLK